MNPPVDAVLQHPPKLHIRRMGRADNHALPVVMLHGAFTGSLASWWMTCAPRVAKFNPVVLYDLRGHGLSQRPAEGYRLADHLDDLARVTAGLGPCALVGHSLGGWIAIEAARAWPDRVSALVGVDVPIGAKRPRTSHEAAEADTASKGTPRARRRHHQLSLAETSFRSDLAAEAPLDVADLASLRCPTLMAFGRQSPFVDGAELARAALGTNSVQMFDGGHALHLDATADLSDAITQFLSGPAITTTTTATTSPKGTAEPDHAHG